MVLKHAGYFEELCHGMEGGGNLAASISDIACEDEDKIVEYLNAGVTLAVSACTVNDVLQPETNVIIGGLSCLTDGVWDWRSDLVYYVENYHVRLPIDFVNHMRKSGWRLPELTDADIARICQEQLANDQSTAS